jgi:hypothetical protein
MAQSALTKMFDEWGGLDLRSNSKNRQPRFATGMRNVMPYSNNSWGVRAGTKGVAQGAGGGGLATYVYVDNDALRQEQVITIDDNLHKLVEGTLTVTYSGPADVATIYIGPRQDVATGGLICDIDAVDEATFPKRLSLGIGYDETPLTTVADLATWINLATGFTATYTGDSTTAAALLQNTQDAIGAGITISFNYWSQLYCPTTDPFATFLSKFNEDDFEIASLFNHANRLWIATGYNKLYKYDSVSVYAAGMPTTEDYSAVVVTSGSLSPETWDTFITYEFIDALGRVVEGNASNVSNPVTSGADLEILHTIPQIQASSEFLTSCAIAANGGSQTGTTFTVDDGSGGTHTLQVGQTAFFRESGGDDIEEVVTARDATSITFANSYTISNNTVISANLRINVWRNRSGGAVPYLVRTLANNSFVATVGFSDSVADVDLETEYDEPVEGHDLPPENLRYLTAYQNLLIGAQPGVEDVGFSDLDGPEYWPSSFQIRSKSNEPIRAVGANKEILLVFRPNETTLVAGDLSSGQYRAEILDDTVGCGAHHSIIDVAGALWFLSSADGIQRIVSTGALQDVGYRISPAIGENSAFGVTEFVHKRCIAGINERRQLVYFFLPVETDTGSDNYPNTQSEIFVADYSNQYDDDNEYDAKGRLVRQVPKVRWWKWDSINMAGGTATTRAIDGSQVPIFTQRILNPVNNVMQYITFRFMETGASWDYIDHWIPITFSYDAGWTDLEEPELLKKWLRTTLYSFSEILAVSFSLTCTLELDFIAEIPRSQKTITFGEGSTSAGWGVPSWGDVTWGELVDVKQLFTFNPNRATAARLRFSTSVYFTAPIISGWSLECAPVYDNHIKKGTE